MSAEEEESRSVGLWRFIKAQLSSGMATFVDWGLITVLHTCGVDYRAYIAVGALGGAVTDFLIKKHWVFEGGSEGELLQQAPRYAAVSAASLAWNELLAYVAVDHFALPALPSTIAASIVVGFVWNYPMHRHYVFRQQPALPSPQ